MYKAASIFSITHYIVKLYFLDKDNEYVIEKKNFVKVTFYTL